MLSLEGVLAVVAIAVGVYAIAQPVQRWSAKLFVPLSAVVILLCLSVVVILWRIAAEVFGYKLYPWSDFLSILTSFFLPLIGIAWAVLRWHRASLRADSVGNRMFRRFVLSCLRESRFDELVRIVEKNEARIADTLTPENLGLLFEERFVDEMSKARTWLPLRLLADAKIVKKLPHRGGPVDTVMRALMSEPASPLCVSVAHSYGTQDPPFSPEEDWGLFERTVENPSWYIELRADYPLLMVACEALDSGALDLAYNRNDELYIAHQGKTTRTRCPVFLALKTHVLVLQRAARAQEDKDFYVSDLYDLFMTVCDHSVYDPGVWRNPKANREYPTPFVFLMGQILLDLSSLFRECHRHRKNRPGQLGNDIVRTWAFCLFYLTSSKGRVSDEFKIGQFSSYLSDCLEVRPVAKAGTCAQGEPWSQLFVDALSKHMPSGDSQERRILLEAANWLDRVRPEVFANETWLREQLDLPDRSEQTP